MSITFFKSLIHGIRDKIQSLDKGGFSDGLTCVDSFLRLVVLFQGLTEKTITPLVCAIKPIPIGTRKADTHVLKHLNNLLLIPPSLCKLNDLSLYFDEHFVRESTFLRLITSPSVTNNPRPHNVLLIVSFIDAVDFLNSVMLATTTPMCRFLN